MPVAVDVEQLGLEHAAPVDEADVPGGGREVSGGASGDLEVLARVDAVGVGDVVVAGDVVDGDVEARGDVAQGVARLHGDAGGAAARLLPPEVPVLVAEHVVEVDDAGAAAAVAQPAVRAEVVVALEVDVVRGRREVAVVVAHDAAVGGGVVEAVGAVVVVVAVVVAG